MTETTAPAALQIAAGFLLDQIRLGRQFLDLTDALIVVSVTQANVEPILRDPVLQRLYATYDRPPPDALRRPIAVHALAQSLRLPFETVRRRVTRLTTLRILRRGPEGIWTPQPVVLAARHRQVCEAGYGRILALYDRLAAFPGLQDLPHEAEPWPGPLPLRAAARLSAEYLLRLVELLTREFDDPLAAAVWMEILRSNSAHGLPGATAPAGLRPARIADVARRLGLPAEAVRRRAQHLTARGACEQGPGGLRVAPTVLTSEAFARIAQRNLADLRRMFTGLALLGALPAPPQSRWLAA